MITLYQLHWSHFVEKVRWALDYKGLAWSAVDVDPFSKRQLRDLQCPLTLESGRTLYTVPTIHDATTGAVVVDSSKILDYLEQTYPTPALYPSDAGARIEMTRWMVWLDSTLGLAARRLAYTQIALERPGILASLFIPHIVGVHRAGSLKGRLAGAVIAGVLSRRFRFAHNRADGVFEQLEECLLLAAQRLSSRRYLVGEQFTAADLTLAALLRPALMLPFFRDHPRLRRLFEWRTTQLREYRREPQVAYETALHDVRQRRGWALGEVHWLARRPHDPRQIPTDIPSLPVARNDQQQLGRWPLISAPLSYLRMRATCGLGRTAYP